MKRFLLAIVIATLGVLSLTTIAMADAYLSINVGGTVLSCNTTTLAGCSAPGFAPVNVGDNSITFQGGTVNGVSIGKINVVGNEPGTAAGAFTTTVNTIFTNNSGSAKTIEIKYANNNFTLPAGSPITFNATDGIDNIAGPSVTTNATGFGDPNNGLVPGVGP